MENKTCEIEKDLPANITPIECKCIFKKKNILMETCSDTARLVAEG